MPREWSITKAEWDGYGRTAPTFGWMRWSSLILTAILGCAFLAMPLVFGALRNTPVPSSVWWIAGTVGTAFLVIPPLLSHWSSRQERRWIALQDVIWESNGCVCPWCRVRVDETPCPTHGFNRDDQPNLIAYWESLPQFAHADGARAAEVLRASARRRPLSWRFLEPIRHRIRVSKASQFDPNLAPLQRLRASLPWMTVKLIAGIAVFAIAYKIVPRSILAGALGGCWPFLLMGPVFLLIGPMWRVGKLRCSACGYICANSQPTVCTECGADLTQPAAVVRRETGSKKAFAIFLIPLCVVFLTQFFQDAVVRALPKPIRDAIWTNLRPPTRYWQSLNPATMTQAEIDEAAQLLIECAAPGGGRPLFDFAFLDSLQKAGKLTPAMLEQAARSVVKATLEVEGSDGRFTASVVPEFGEPVMPIQMTPRLVFGGVSVDDGPYAQWADWSLFHDDLDEFWRANGQLPALPSEKLTFRADLGGLAAGDHRIRARCFIVLHSWRWVRYAPKFDEHGELIAPAGATTYQLLLETTVRVPEA